MDRKMNGIVAAAAFVASLAAIAVGCALIYLPAGLIVGGLLGLGSVALWMRGATTERQQ